MRGDKELNITRPYLTIAGQTTPSSGVSTKRSTIDVLSHAIFIQHIRVWPGDVENGPAIQNRDCIRVRDEGNQDDVYNIVIDHCSFSWATGENISTFNDPYNITYSNNIISEALDEAVQGDRDGYIAFIDGSNDGSEGATNVALLGNAIINCRQRTPKLANATESIVVNNIMYNGAYYSGVTIGGGSSLSKSSIVENICISGPESSHAGYAVDIVYGRKGTHVYAKDNECTYYDQNDDWACVRIHGKNYGFQVEVPPVSIAGITLLGRINAKTWVLGNAGARQNDRDALDTRVFAYAQNTTCASLIARAMSVPIRPLRDKQ